MAVRARRVHRCITCTRRKVKCDEIKPRCERCQRSGLQCEGYDQTFSFINHAVSTTQGDSRPKPTQTQAQAPPPPCRQAAGHKKRDVRPPKSINRLLPHEDSVFVTHILSKFTPPIQTDPSAPMSMLPRLIMMDKSLGAQALSAIYFGKMRNDHRVYQKGTRLYVGALDQVRQLLVDPKRALETSTLASVLCLCIYENIVLSEPGAWLKHYEGVSRLVQLRGPGRYENDMEKNVFRMCRFMIILNSGIQRRRCYLAETRWKSTYKVPKLDHQGSIDLLYDIFSDVPGIFEDFDKLTPEDKALPSPSFSAVRGRMKSTLRALHDWPRKLDQTRVNIQGVGISTAGPETGLPPRDQTDAAALALCYAIILCLMQPCAFLDLSILPRAVPGSVGPAVEAGVERALASEICHLATSALYGQHSTAAAFFFIFPLQIAHQHLNVDSPEGLRLEGVMENTVGDTHGFEIGRRREWGDLRSPSPER